jgi:hypothetical protein
MNWHDVAPEHQNIIVIAAAMLREAEKLTASRRCQQA